MWTCEKCHIRTYGVGMVDAHIAGFSHGPCEACKQTGTCADCHCSVSVKRSQPNVETIRILKKFVNIEEPDVPPTPGLRSGDPS